MGTVHSCMHGNMHEYIEDGVSHVSFECEFGMRNCCMHVLCEIGIYAWHKITVCDHDTQA